ncbi:MAG: hypothetical protein KDC53_21320, partial [Saprospiraceae bacterium]|nr:hypothetical protein [Saprospiraceae bacterium]
KDFEERIDINSQLSNTKHAALRYLWAREKIRWNSDFIGLTADEKRKQKITQLGLTYNLLTDYTSFVAIDEIEKVNSDGVVTRIKQPLPLPQNVSNYAVGFEMEIDGVSVANKIPAKLNLSALVLEGQDPLKRTLTEEFNRAISMWDESWQNQWMNKKLVIDVAQTLTESKIYLDGFEISGSRRRAILQILNSLKEVLAKGDRIVIKFVRRP